MSIPGIILPPWESLNKVNVTSTSSVSNVRVTISCRKSNTKVQPHNYSTSKTLYMQIVLFIQKNLITYLQGRMRTKSAALKVSIQTAQHSRKAESVMEADPVVGDEGESFC